MSLPRHLITSEADGGLYDTRGPRLSKAVRPNYKMTHTHIETVADLKATLRAEKFAWPGGYPLYFLTDDRAALSFKTVREELRLIIDSIKNKHRDGWRVVACAINWEDAELYCAHTGERIPSAYAEDEAPAKCKACTEFFARYRCGCPNECDCPPNQGLCECDQ